MSELVLVADADGVRTLTLNRPESRNAFNAASQAINVTNRRT